MRFYIIISLIAMILNITDAYAMSALGGKHIKADRILVEKSSRRMILLLEDKIIKIYKISLGMQPVGAKIKRGDNKTPEGNYYIAGRKQNSRFHRSLKISYPNDKDLERAKILGVDPGGDIMIHGVQKNHKALDRIHKLKDWTQGCIAVKNHEIEEIWSAVSDGAPIEILP